MHKIEKNRTAASLTVMVILSVAIFLLFFSIELLTGYLSPQKLVESLRVSDYGVRMEQEMLKKQRELFASYGLPESLTQEIWEENEVYLAFYQYVDGKDTKENGDFGQRKVLENYLEEQSAYVSESVQKAMETVISESEAICGRYVYPDFVTTYRQYVQERKPALIGTVFLSMAVSVLGILVLFRWYHCRHHALRYMTGSLFTAAIWNMIGTIVIQHAGDISAIDVETQYYKKFLEIYESKGMYPWYIASAVAVAMTIMLFMTGIHMRNRQ